MHLPKIGIDYQLPCTVIATCAKLLKDRKKIILHIIPFILDLSIGKNCPFVLYKMSILVIQLATGLLNLPLHIIELFFVYS